MIITIRNEKTKDNSKDINYDIIRASEFLTLLQNNEEQHLVEISKKRIVEKVIINNSLSKNIKLTNCHFDEDLIFLNCKILGTFKLETCTSNAPIYFLSGNYHDVRLYSFVGTQISFQGGEFDYCDISYEFLSSIDILGGYFKESLIVNSATNNHSTTDLPSFTIDLMSNSKLGNVSVYSQALDRINLNYGKTMDSNIHFSNISVNHVFIFQFVNSSILRFTNIKALGSNSNWQIEDSDLGKCEFVRIDFSKFRLTIDDSILTEIKSLNVKWPKIISSKTNDYNIMQECYRQLKVAMLNQGNKIQALVFEKDELNSHYKTLKWKQNYLDKIILATNWTNNQGQSWYRPFWILMITNFFFLISIKYFLGYTTIDLNYLPFDIANFLTILNPAHSSKMFGVEINTNNYAYLLDSIHRIITAYLLYQFIIAFRKYFNRK